MYQYYVVEIQEVTPGNFAHLVHVVNDENSSEAIKKAESKYYQVLSYAAVSGLPSHAAILFSSKGFPVMNQCYTTAQTQETESESVPE